MQERSTLASIFLARADIHGAPPPTERLGALLQRAWDSAHSRWSDIPLAPEGFMEYLAGLLPCPTSAGAVEQWLEQLPHADLYLACACARAIPAAHAALERHYIATVPVIVGHMKLSETAADEVKQRVREKLLLRTEVPPKITEYSGRSTLANWMRVVTLNTAVSMLREAREPVAEGDAALEVLPAPDKDPELEAIRHRHQGDFRRALEDAFAALPSERRYLLRLAFVDRLSTTQIGALLGVNQSTASRRLISARQVVYDETRRLLQERLRLSTEDLTSLLRVIQSHLDLSISRILAGE